MRAVCIFLLVAVLGVQNLTLGAPLTKWFKTDNNTYYIEADQKYSWQESYAECKSRNLNLLSMKHFNDDELLNEYLKQMFTPVPDFWLRSDVAVDLSNMLPSITEDFFKIKMEDAEVTDFLIADNPDNCVLTKDGATKACNITHGFICKAPGANGNGAQNIQNIILQFS